VPALGHDVARGLDALREAVACALLGDLAEPQLAVALADGSRRTPPGASHPLDWLLSEAAATNDKVGSSSRPQTQGNAGFGDADQAASSE
jgi:hypothetical protein